MPEDDDEQVRKRLLALEREVRAESQEKAARAAAAAERVAARSPAKAPLPASPPARLRPAKKQERADEDLDDSSPTSALGDLSRGLALTRKADDVRQELARPREAQEKSWKVSTGLSLVFGPIGWLYAGSWREAIPGAAAYALAAVLLSYLPTFLLLPAFVVGLPLSALAGLSYALGYNRNGRRIRLFGKDGKKTEPPTKSLSPGGSGRRR